MTKKLILTITALLSLTICQAQLYIGVNSGYNYTKIHNSSDAKADERQDYVNTFKPSFGLDFGYKLAVNISLGIKPQYFSVAQNFKGTDPDHFVESINAKFTLEYLRLPIYAKFEFGKPENKLRYNLNFGAYYGILLSQKIASIENLVINGLPNSITQQTTNFKNNSLIRTSVIKKNGGDSVIEQRYNMQSGYFATADYGLSIGFGQVYTINSKINFSYTFESTFGLANVEYTKDIVFTDPTTNVEVNRFNISQYRYCRFNRTSIGSTEELRSIKSNNIAIGIQLGINYNL
jgi:hypothetical protein